MQDEAPVVEQLEAQDRARVAEESERPDLPDAPPQHETRDGDRGPRREAGQPGRGCRSDMRRGDQDGERTRGFEFGVDDDRTCHGTAFGSRGAHYNRGAYRSPSAMRPADILPMTIPAAPCAALPADSVAIRADLELLEISGPDAPRFLQGQCTADVETLAIGRWTWGGYCTPKGRLLATFRVGRRDDGYVLQLPAGTAGTLATRLRRFVMRSRVTLAPVTALPAALWVDGAGALAPTVEALGLGAVGPGDFRVTGSAVVFGTDRGGVAHLSHERAATVAAGVQASVIPALLAELTDLRSGLPWIQPAVEDAFVPQMVGLDRIDGVSFTKGCYPGQEIVARTRYLGTVKRHLHHVILAGPAVAGDPVVAGDAQVGTILGAATPAGQATEALAVIDAASAASGALSTAAGPIAGVRRVHPDADA